MKDEFFSHLNRGLKDIKDEEWIDFIGHDGLYNVSTFGRVKSLGRYKVNRWGTETWKPETILKQHITRSKTKRVDGLMVTIGHKAYLMGKAVFMSFNPDVDFGKNECVMHNNKNVCDNRLLNLKKVTRKTSKGVDMIKSIPTIIATPKNMKLAQIAQKEFYDNRTHRVCDTCGKIDLLQNFPDERNKCQSCVNKYVKTRRKDFKYSEVLKKCNECGVEKKDTEFPKLNNTCKTCCYEKHKKFQDEQRKNIGDWYVKEYAKFNYGTKEFTPELITKFRNEIIESRKPKYFLDGKSFLTVNELADYINSKYKVPLPAIKKRISEGRTEKECTLNRSEFIRHNKKLQRQ